MINYSIFWLTSVALLARHSCFVLYETFVTKKPPEGQALVQNYFS